MFSKHVRLLCFLLTLPSLLGRPDGLRLPVDNSVRGNSFGLENFLFQSYDAPEVKDVVRIPKPKRVRPALDPRVTSDRGQTYGLENLSAQVYESTRLKPAVVKPTQEYPKQKPLEPTQEHPKWRPLEPTREYPKRRPLEPIQEYPKRRPLEPTQEYPKRRPLEPTAEANKIRENFIATPIPEVTDEPPQTSTQPAERIRKRIMMRRRRKRPSNAVQQDGNSDITGNAILQPLRIPIYPQVPKVVIRTKLPDSPSNKIVKSPIIVPTEKEITEEVTEREEVVTTEKPIPSTTKPTTTTDSPSTINLKTFLKLQTETLSLSELLQTQNLSLADLLKGSKDASAILKVRQGVTSTTPATSTRRKQFNRVEPDKPKPTKKVEAVEVTTSRPNYNGFQPKIPRTKTSETVKPTEETQEDNSKPIKRPAYSSDPVLDPQNRLNDLRSKLRNFQKKTTTPEVTSEPTVKQETIEPVSATPKTTEIPLYKKNRVSFKSTNNPDLSLILPNKVKPELDSQKKPEMDSQKRPERLTNWTSRLPSIKRFGQDRPKPNELLKKPLRVPIQVEDNSSEEETATTAKPEELPEADIRKPEPKDELIELLKSGQHADRLQKILTSRNMTLQELLDNREKPPLQMDISTLFSNEQRPSSTQPTLFDSLPDFQLDETDSPAYDEPEAEESAPSIARVELIPSREPKQYEFPVSEKGVSKLNLQPDDLTADTSKAEDSAVWKLSEKSIFYGSSFGYGDFPAVQQTEKPKTVKTELSESDIILLETIRRNQETNRKFKLDLNEFVREDEPETEDIEKSYIPPAVKSAIIASGVVMGIALFVFIAIFAACGWKQRQIRLKGSSSVLGGKSEKSKRTLSPVSFKDNHSYKKTLDFDDETSESGTSNTSSYLWSTLKNTFTSRASTLKSRLEKEEKVREDKVTLRRNESRRKESRPDDRPITDEVYAVKKIDRDRNVVNTSFNFKRSHSNANHFNECVHGY